VQTTLWSAKCPIPVIEKKEKEKKSGEKPGNRGN
jgi:hypothetical protein